MERFIAIGLYAFINILTPTVLWKLYPYFLRRSSVMVEEVFNAGYRIVGIPAIWAAVNVLLMWALDLNVFFLLPPILFSLINIGRAFFRLIVEKLHYEHMESQIKPIIIETMRTEEWNVDCSDIDVSKLRIQDNRFTAYVLIHLENKPEDWLRHANQIKQNVSSKYPQYQLSVYFKAKPPHHKGRL